MDIQGAFELITSKLADWAREVIRLLPNLVLAAVILVLGIYASKWVRKLFRKTISRLVANEVLVKLFSSIFYIVLIGVVVFSALSVLNLDKVVTSVLAGAGIIGLALAFAFQDIATNFMSGIFISLRKPLHVGDIVNSKDYKGKVVDINLRDTVLQTFQGQMVIIPNKEILQNPIENFTMLGKRRMDLTVGISYGEDLNKVKSVTLEAVQGIDHTTDDEIKLYYHEFGDSSINFTVRIWVDSAEQSDYWHVMDEAIIRIKNAFDKNDITIPFPIRTLDFGIKGGKTLAEMETLSNNNNEN